MTKKMLTYGSLFSGIGGFDLGFDQAGMRCAWQVEKDAMARGVLANHWPDIKKYKEVQDVGKRNLSPVNVIIGGFPCQDVSLAGRREGLAGERSGLWFEFIRIVNELTPEWVIIENVPGLLSSNRGRDMGTIVGGLAKCGYWWAYRIIDAQYHGVPQRRRRVFVVASLTKGRPHQVLFERESSPWDTPPRREAGPGVAGSTQTGVGVGGKELGYALRSNPARSGEGVNTSNRGKSTGDKAETLRADSHGALPLVVAFTQNSRDEVRKINGDGQIVGALAAQPGMKQQNYLAFGGNNTKGEIEVATAETFICGALPAHSKRHGHAIGTQQAAESGHLIAATLNSGGNDGGFRTEPGEHLVVTPTLTGKIADGNRKGWAPVNEADALVVENFDKSGDTLYNKGISQTGGLSDASTQKTNAEEVLSVLRGKIGEEAFAEWGLGVLNSLQHAKILQSSVHGEGFRRQAKNRRSKVDDSALSCKKESSPRPMREMWVTEWLRRASQKRQLEGQYKRELGAYLSQLSYQGTQKKKALRSLWEASKGIRVLQQALSEIQEVGKSMSSQEKSTFPTSGVRRLTPLEAERLQGFPDHWTKYGVKDGKIIEQSDSARYRQLGNAVAVPVAKWIGQRIIRSLEI